MSTILYAASSHVTHEGLGVDETLSVGLCDSGAE